MQTRFSLAQLADPDLADANGILRACVHCGFCTATCPTYVLLGDELDSPRGRIYLIKDMLENERPASAEVVRHVDRCLTCLSCMTTCPADVNYLHLVDHGRRHIAGTYRRPLPERLLHRLLTVVLARPWLFRLAVAGARLLGPARRLLPGRLGGIAGMAPKEMSRPAAVDRPGIYRAEGPRRLRVALLSGCAQQVLSPCINEATVRLLTRHGCEVVVAKGAGCCGALGHHLGEDTTAMMRANIDAWMRVFAAGGLDAVVINASGCGTMVKDYGHILRNDPVYTVTAARISALARDVTEIVAELGLAPAIAATGQRVAYHSACSLQHGQRIAELPKRLLAAAGFIVLDVPEGHLCCGSAGTYNLLQPVLADALRARKVENIVGTRPDLIAAGNIGCITQIAAGTAVPIVHTVELLDWATGGPKPAALG